MEETIEAFECKVSTDKSILSDIVAWFESHGLDAPVGEHEVGNIFSYDVTLMAANAALLGELVRLLNDLAGKAVSVRWLRIEAW
jgi:hypothetical protein